jgi:predicted TPR repeat methyltransferase
MGGDVLSAKGAQGPPLPGSRLGFEEAERLHGLGQVREAEAACRAVLGEDASHVGALRLLGNIAFNAGHGAEAVELLALAVRAAPEDARVHGDLGLMQLGLARPAQAIPPLRRAVALAPGSAANHNNLAIALRDLGRLEEAEAECRKALELDATFAPAHGSLGEVLRRRVRLPEARHWLESALRLAPGTVAARVALGDVLVEQGESMAAIDHYRQAIGVTRRPAALYVRLGIALRVVGDPSGAIEAYRTAVTLDPAAPEAHYHLAQALLAQGSRAEALASIEQAIRLRAEFPAAHALHGVVAAALGDLEGGLNKLRVGQAPGTDRGQCLALLAGYLLELGYPERALECQQLKLALEPADPAARHFVAALSGANPERPADDYVRQLFDSYADNFDQQLVGHLSYCVPAELAQAVLSSSRRSPPWDVLDMGCGTGLVGAELAAHARSLVGVDLSSKMIERARERGVYTRLICGDLALALQAEHGYDVVTAGDVFIYVGKLDAIVPLVHRALRAGGVFAFTVESAEDAATVPGVALATGYGLAIKGRYVHHGDYLRALALRHGFEIVLMHKTRLRCEDRRPVRGWLAVWRAG